MTMKHYVIFFRTYAHCAMFFVHAASLVEAMVIYSIQYKGVELLENGSLKSGDGWGGDVIYSHTLECIESEERADGWNGNSWEIQELKDTDWNTPFAEAFWSNDPDDIKTWIEMARPIFRAAFPKSRAKAFVWYLKEGILVTFHRRKSPTRRWPIEIMARYLLPWKDKDRVQPWHGTYDDILAQKIP